MLVLKRTVASYPKDTIYLTLPDGRLVEIILCGASCGSGRIGIVAPNDVRITRAELAVADGEDSDES